MHTRAKHTHTNARMHNVTHTRALHRCAYTHIHKSMDMQHTKSSKSWDEHTNTMRHARTPATRRQALIQTYMHAQHTRGQTGAQAHRQDALTDPGNPERDPHITDAQVQTGEQTHTTSHNAAKTNAAILRTPRRRGYICFAKKKEKHSK